MQQDLHVAAAHTFAASVGESANWFSHAGGIKSIAQAGTHTIQANTDQLEILADQSFTVTSSNDEIHVLAKEKIVLQAGQSSVTLEGGNITFACPGTFSVKGSGNAFLGPGSSPAGLEGLPEGTSNHVVEIGKFDDELEQLFVICDENEKPIPGFSYRINESESKLYESIVEQDGITKKFSMERELSPIFWIAQRGCK